MKEWLSQYGYLLIVFVAVLIVAAVIFYFAVKATAKHNRTFKAQEAEMRRLLALKEKYMDFTEATLEENADEELLEGVALSYQIRLQRRENPEKAYEELNEEKKFVYVLDVFCADGDAKIFFSENGDMIKDRILPALENIGMRDFALKLRDAYDMYDNSNEEVSYSEKRLEEINNYISENDILTAIKLAGAKYIKSHYEELKN